MIGFFNRFFPSYTPYFKKFSIEISYSCWESNTWKKSISTQNLYGVSKPLYPRISASISSCRRCFLFLFTTQVYNEPWIYFRVQKVVFLFFVFASISPLTCLPFFAFIPSLNLTIQLKFVMRFTISILKFGPFLTLKSFK